MPNYGPYLFKMIEDTWSQNFPGEPVVIEHMVSHGILKLRVKEKWGIAPPEAEIAPTDSDDELEPDFDDDSYVPPPETVPSWGAKLQAKMKSLLCFQIKGRYKAHVMDKKARSRDKKIMRKMGLAYDSGSEERITDEDEWIKQNCRQVRR